MFTLPVKFATEVNVPAVSKKSTNKNAKAVPINPAVAISEKSRLNACAGDGIAPTTPLISAIPNTQSITLTAKIPIIIAPGTFLLSKIAIIAKPKPASSTGQDEMSPRPTSVAGLSTTTPAFLNPMIAKNKPIPAPIPSFIERGIELMIYFLAGVTLSAMNTIPAIKTAASACWKVYPIPKITPNVKKAFSPIPGASATGHLAHSPIINVPITAAMIVAVNTAPKSMPVPSVERIAGFTTVMYAIVKNVATPAMISVFTEVFAFDRPNSLSNIFFSSYNWMLIF